MPAEPSNVEADGSIGLIACPGFLQLWIADTLTNFGGFILPLAIQFYMIDILSANQFEIGIVRAAQQLPHLLFGLIAGAIIDRVRRKRLLIAADLASGSTFIVLVTLGMLGLLNLASLVVLVFLIGAISVLQSGAHQSFVADLLPSPLLTKGVTRLTQTWTAAQTLGPLVGGALVRLFGAPIALILTGAIHFVSATLLLRVPEGELVAKASGRTSLVDDIKVGMRWVYGHPTLAPYALTLHAWFIGNGICGTVYIFYAVSLGLDSVDVGITLACGGVAGILGAALAQRISMILGLGPAASAAYGLCGAAWLLIAAAPALGAPFAWFCVAYSLFGFGLGLSNPVTMSYRNAITPPELRGRMNTTIRTFNWGLIAFAAPVGGWAAGRIGTSPVLFCAALIMILAGGILMLTPYRLAAMPVATGR